MSSPNRRNNTRSNSTSSSITLEDIRQLITAAKQEIISNTNEKFDDINRKLTELTNRVHQLEESVLSVKQDNESQAKEIDCLKTQVWCLKDMPTFVLNEVEDRNRRRLNLMISGIPECSSGSVEERKVFDEKNFSSMTAEIGVNDTKPTNIIRIGRATGDRPRLMKATFHSPELRDEILRKGKFLRNSTNFPRSYINPDLTITQRQENKSLRDELRQRKAVGEKVMIRGGKVVEIRDGQNFQ